MKAPSTAWLALVCIAASLVFISAACGDDAARKEADATELAAEDTDHVDERDSRKSQKLARDRAKILHEVYAATLEVMHQRYFHGDTAVVPARALEDVFSEMQRTANVEARWISVNLKPMSIKHEPRTRFEKRAAAAIADGKGHLEVVEDGYYRRAGAIPLSSGCVTCHSGFFRAQSKTPKFAGLVISIPLDVKKNASESQEDSE